LGKILNWLKWRIWWLITPKFNQGVFVVVFERDIDSDYVLVVQKRLGVGGTNNYTLPGGARKYKENLQEAGIRELWEETRILFSGEDLILIDVYSRPYSRDQQVVFWCDVDRVDLPKVINPSFEIAMVQKIDINDVDLFMRGNDDHISMTLDAYEFFENRYGPHRLN